MNTMQSHFAFIDDNAKRNKRRRIAALFITCLFTANMVGCSDQGASSCNTEVPKQASASPAVQSGAGVSVDGKMLGITIPESDINLFVAADIVYPELGAAFEYNESIKKATVQFGLQAFKIPAGCGSFLVNGRKIMVESPPYLLDGHLMVPLRAIAESVGGGVRWDGDLKAWQVYSRNNLEDTVDIMGDGTPLKVKLSGYERYFTDDQYIFWSALRDGASIYRSDLDGKHIERLVDAATEIIGMDGDDVFFINITESNHLYSIKKDGTDLKQLVPESVFNPKMNGSAIQYFSLENGLAACSVGTDGTGRQILDEEITVMDGDWVIDDNTVITGQTILLKGNLMVKEGSVLTLEDTRLVFDTGNEGETERRIDINGASIIIRNSDIRSTGQNNGIVFYALESDITIEGSRISNMSGNIELELCNQVRCAGNYVINGAGSGFIHSTRTSGAVYENNIVINKDRDQMPWITFQCSHAKDMIIRDNVCVDQGECLFFQQASGGLVTGNLVLGEQYSLCLSLRHDAGNVIYDNNFLQCNYDNGYRISEWSYGDALYSDTLEATTTFSRNVINNAMHSMRLKNMKNCVYDSNRVWLQLFDMNENRMGAAGLSMQYSHHCELINNSFESWNGGTAAQLFYCSDNRFEGNTFTGFTYGIELWNKSDDNNIKANRLVDCGSGILLNGSTGNTVTNNSIISTKGNAVSAYTEGDNLWDSNYYSDWQNPQALGISDTVSDHNSLSTEPLLYKAEPENTPFEYDYAAEFDDKKMNGNEFVTDERFWKDETVNYTWFKFQIIDGGSVTMENVTWLSPLTYNSEPEVFISNGGELIMKNCRIVADPEGMPFYFGVDSGGTLIAENCTFENIDEISISDGNATFENCTFTDCYQALVVYNSKNVVIENCIVINSFTGITGSYGFEASNTNTQNNIAIAFKD